MSRGSETHEPFQLEVIIYVILAEDGSMMTKKDKHNIAID